MASTIKIKSNATAGKVPTTLETGELAVNVVDKQLYVGDAAKAPQALIPVATPLTPVWNRGPLAIIASGPMLDANITPNEPMLYSVAGATAIDITIPDPATLPNWLVGQPLAFYAAQAGQALTFTTTGLTIEIPDDKVFEPRKPFSVIVMVLVDRASKLVLAYGDLKDK